MKLEKIITIGAQYGDDVGSGFVDEYRLELLKLATLALKQCYGADVEKIHMALRVSGSVVQWPEIGPNRLRVAKKARYASAEVGIPMTVWLDQPSKSVAKFVIDNVSDALAGLMQRVRRQGLEFDTEEFLRDWAKVRTAYELIFPC